MLSNRWAAESTADLQGHDLINVGRLTQHRIPMNSNTVHSGCEQSSSSTASRLFDSFSIRLVSHGYLTLGKHLHLFKATLINHTDNLKIAVPPFALLRVEHKSASSIISSPAYRISHDIYITARYCARRDVALYTKVVHFYIKKINS